MLEELKACFLWMDSASVKVLVQQLHIQVKNTMAGVGTITTLRIAGGPFTMLITETSESAV
jgi:hypothetical protein